MTLNYAEGTSDAPPLVLLHGLAARWQVFAPLLARLDADWHVYAPDMRGHGGSAHTPGGYVMTEVIADATAFLREVVATPAVVYGHSVGGWVALALAAGNPDLVRAVVVGDSPVFLDSVDPDQAVSYLADLPLAMRSMAVSLKQLDPEVMERYRAGALAEGYDPEPLLPNVRCPALLLQADPTEGGLMGDRDVERALALLSDARHVRFDGIGHGLHVQDATAVHDAIVPFFDELH